MQRESEREMGGKAVKAEGLLRLSSLLLAAASAAVVGLDSQTETVLFRRKKATYWDLEALGAFVIIAIIASGYHFLQLCRCVACAWLPMPQSFETNKFMSWIWLIFDQCVAYAMLAGTVAATQGSMVAVTGVKPLQWTKLCNVFTRFCDQIAGGMLCGLAASVAMAIISAVSARRLFRLYPACRRRSRLPSPATGTSSTPVAVERGKSPC